MKTIQTYYLNIPKALSNEEKCNILSRAINLPPQKYKAILELSDETAKMQSIISYFLLLRILKENKIKIENTDFTYENNGKPYFTNSKIKFNISHSENTIAVAISNSEIGIDVEKIRKINPNLIKWVYSEKEQKKYFDKILDINFFYKTWTIKESYAKFNGSGLNIDFNSLSFDLELKSIKFHDIIIETYKIEDFYISICSKSKKIQIKKYDFEQLFTL